MWPSLGGHRHRGDARLVCAGAHGVQRVLGNGGHRAQNFRHRMAHRRQHCHQLRLRARSAHRRDGRDGHFRWPAHFHFLLRLHEGRQADGAFFLLPFAFRRRNAGPRFGEQFAAAFHVLGNRWRGVVFAHQFLEPQTRSCRRREKSIHRHPHRRHGFSHWNFVGLQNHRHADALR